MPQSNVNAFDSWAETNKLFVRCDAARPLADAYVSWRGRAGKQLGVTEQRDALLADHPWGEGIVAPPYGGYATLITGAALLTTAQVHQLAQHLSAQRQTLVIAVPAALENAPCGYAIFEAGQMVFRQDLRDVGGEIQVTTHGAPWLAAKHLSMDPTDTSAAAWQFDRISDAIGLRAWEFDAGDRHIYLLVHEGK